MPDPDGPAGQHSTTVAHPSADSASTDHDPDHGVGHEGEALGPIDWAAWGVGALGVAVGLVIAFCFALSAGII